MPAQVAATARHPAMNPKTALYALADVGRFSIEGREVSILDPIPEAMFLPGLDRSACQPTG